MPFDRGASGLADFWIPEKSEAEVSKEALDRIKSFEQEERHVEEVISNLHTFTNRWKKPKDIPTMYIKQVSNKVLSELRKLQGAFGELKIKGSDSSVKAFDEFVAYVKYWQFVNKEGRIPGVFQFKLMRFNVKTVDHVLEDIARLLGKSVVELKFILKNTHKRFKDTHIEYIRH